MPRFFTLTLLLLAVAASGSLGATSPAFTFGRTGGNIRPFAVTIASGGRVSGTGAVQLVSPAPKLSAAVVSGLRKLARAEGFYAAPVSARCPNVLPDVAALYVTIRSAGTTRTVSVKGGCNSSFGELFETLLAVSGATA